MTRSSPSSASEPDSGTIVRRLMRGCEHAALATSLAGAPYVSLVLVAFDLDASPLLLLSDLARHSRNVAAEPRVSLLFDGTAGHTDPLAGPRLTLLGQVRASADPRLLARFTERHPASRAYAGFADFRLYRVCIARGHFVAGFGRIEWIDGGSLRCATEARDLAAEEPELLRRINEENAALLRLLAVRRFGSNGEGWRVSGVDPEGLDLRRAGETRRLDFPAPVTNAAAVSAALEELVRLRHSSQKEP